MGRPLAEAGEARLHSDCWLGWGAGEGRFAQKPFQRPLLPQHQSSAAQTPHTGPQTGHTLPVKSVSFLFGRHMIRKERLHQEAFQEWEGLGVHTSPCFGFMELWKECFDFAHPKGGSRALRRPGALPSRSFFVADTWAVREAQLCSL